MKQFLNLATVALLAVVAGCTTPATQHVQDPGPTATCQVCRYNNDLGCVTVKVKDTTPRAEYHGQTFCFCSADCRAAFVKNPGKYLSKIGDHQSTVPQ